MNRARFRGRFKRLGYIEVKDSPWQDSFNRKVLNPLLELAGCSEPDSDGLSLVGAAELHPREVHKALCLAWAMVERGDLSREEACDRVLQAVEFPGYFEQLVIDHDDGR